MDSKTKVTPHTEVLEYLRRYRILTGIFMIFTFIFMGMYFYEAEEFFIWSWHNPDVIAFNNLDAFMAGQDMMFMQIYTTPDQVLKAIESGDLEWQTVPNNIKYLMEYNFTMAEQDNP
jgi:hypothetical protein